VASKTSSARSRNQWNNRSVSKRSRSCFSRRIEDRACLQQHFSRDSTSIEKNNRGWSAWRPCIAKSLIRIPRITGTSKIHSTPSHAAPFQRPANAEDRSISGVDEKHCSNTHCALHQSMPYDSKCIGCNRPCGFQPASDNNHIACWAPFWCFQKVVFYWVLSTDPSYLIIDLSTCSTVKFHPSEVWRDKIALPVMWQFRIRFLQFNTSSIVLVVLASCRFRRLMAKSRFATGPDSLISRISGWLVKS
jgi:hypothetical protein